MTNPGTTDEAAGHRSDMDLPGMWSYSDFLGGDPDTRSYAERRRSATPTEQAEEDQGQ